MHPDASGDRSGRRVSTRSGDDRFARLSAEQIRGRRMGSLVAGTELDGAVVGAMIVLDTNVVSEIVKARPHPSVVTWWNSHDAKEFYITTITVAELLQGVNHSPEGRKSDELAETVLEAIDFFGVRILEFDMIAAT